MTVQEVVPTPLTLAALDHGHPVSAPGGLTMSNAQQQSSWSSDNESDSGCASSTSGHCLSAGNASDESSSCASSECGHISDTEEDVTTGLAIAGVAASRRASDTPAALLVGPQRSLNVLAKSSKARGNYSWHSLFMEADYVLEKWESYGRHRRPVVRRHPLKGSFKLCCPEASLANNVLVGRFRRLPLRRTLSELGLGQGSAGDVQESRTVVSRAEERRQSMCFLDELVSSRVGVNRLEKKVQRRSSLVDSDWSDSSSVHSDDSGASAAHETIRLSSFRPISEVRPSPAVYSLFECPKRPISSAPSARDHATRLVQGLKLSNGIFLAMQITSIDQGLLMQLRPVELLQLVLGKRNCLTELDLGGVSTMVEFGKQLTDMVRSVVTAELTAEGQADKISAFVEVACALRKLRNWHSLLVVVKALQCPKIYCLEQSWRRVEKKFPVHFADFVTLSELVSKCDQNLLRSKSPAIPSLDTLVKLFRIHCAAKWDLSENKPRWTESPNLSGWLEKQLVGLAPELLKRVNRLDIPSVTTSESLLDVPRKTMLPDNDHVRFIPMSSLPATWTQHEARQIPTQFKRDVVDCFMNSFNFEMGVIRRYGIFRGEVRVQFT